MNILIVTPFFKHDRNIASVRWTNLATRLCKRHNVIVVTQPHDDMDMTESIARDEDGILVARLNQKTAYEKFAVKHFGGATGDDWQTGSSNQDAQVPTRESAVRKLKNHVLFASMKMKARQYATQIAKQVVPKGTKIDVVISSACPFIEMLFGYELKKKLKCKWISDFRDLPYKSEDRHDSQLMKKIMKHCLNVADAVVSISYRGKEYLQKHIVKDVDKVHVITNGFSMTDAKESIYQDDGILHIVHTGSLYGGTRKSDLLFKAAQMAHQKNPKFSYVLDCAGGNNETLIETAKKYGEDKNVYNRGFIAREEALKMQATADILLALVVKTTGSFVAKMFEYLLNQKPVICVSCGPGESSEETEFVRKTNLGIAVEEGEENAEQELCDYLLTQFELKAKSMKPAFSPDEKVIREYDHDVLVSKFEELFRNIV